MNRPTISREAQRAVAYLLTRLMFAETMEDVHSICDYVYKKFHLCDYPLTGFPVCDWDYIRLIDSKTQQ